MLTDPIADMLTRVRNSLQIRAEKVDIPISKIKLEIAKILKEEGFIRAYKILKDRRQGILRIIPKYLDNKSIITGLKRVSKPGRRVYVNKSEIPKVMGGLGVAILTTSRGVLGDKTCKQEGVGGEVICYVW
jgi:small subunit ribosomal protein S8